MELLTRRCVGTCPRSKSSNPPFHMLDHWIVALLAFVSGVAVAIDANNTVVDPDGDLEPVIFYEGCSGDECDIALQASDTESISLLQIDIHIGRSAELAINPSQAELFTAVAVRGWCNEEVVLELTLLENVSSSISVNDALVMSLCDTTGQGCDDEDDFSYRDLSLLQTEIHLEDLNRRPSPNTSLVAMGADQMLDSMHTQTAQNVVRGDSRFDQALASGGGLGTLSAAAWAPDADQMRAASMLQGRASSGVLPFKRGAPDLHGQAFSGRIPFKTADQDLRSTQVQFTDVGSKSRFDQALASRDIGSVLEAASAPDSEWRQAIAEFNRHKGMAVEGMLDEWLGALQGSSSLIQEGHNVERARVTKAAFRSLLNHMENSFRFGSSWLAWLAVTVFFVVLLGWLLMVLTFRSPSEMPPQEGPSTYAREQATPQPKAKPLLISAFPQAAGDVQIGGGPPTRGKPSLQSWQQSQVVFSGPPPICLSLILPRTEARFIVSSDALLSLTTGTLDILGTSGRKLLHVSVSAVEGGRRCLTIASCRVEDDELRACILSPHEHSADLEVFGKDNIPYGTIQVGSGSGGLLVHSKGPVMSIETGNEANLRMTALSIQGSLLASAGRDTPVSGQCNEASNLWKLRVKPGADAVLILACMLGIIILRPWPGSGESNGIVSGGDTPAAF